VAPVTTPARMAQALLARLEREGKLDDNLRYEILNGELVIRGLPSTSHEGVVSALAYHFLAWVREHGGKAFTGSGIEIADHQLRPDLVFMGPDRVGEIAEEGFYVPPDLVAEVTSPGTRSLDLNEKRAIYETLGVGEYWVVDHLRNLVLVHRLDAGAYEVTEHGEGALTARAAPGLEVPVAELVDRGQ
jgi:Uma2 family endonuclease